MRAILHSRAIQRPPHPQPSSAIPDDERQPTAKGGVQRRQAALLSLTCDFMFLMVLVGTALVFRVLIIALWPEAGQTGDRRVVEWLSTVMLVGNWLWFFGLDGLRWVRSSRILPFEYTERVIQHIYLRRIEISLWMMASCVVLLCLCMFFVRTPLPSKVFFTSLVALGILAVRKSIPVRQLSLAIATITFFSILIAIKIASVVMMSGQPESSAQLMRSTLTANHPAANQLATPPKMG